MGSLLELGTAAAGVFSLWLGIVHLDVGLVALFVALALGHGALAATAWSG